MKLKLISFALCPYVHRSTIVLHEKNIPFDIEYIDLADKPAWFLELSPRGKVPVLIADGVTIFESAVINEFLDETHPPRMLPAEPLPRAAQRAWIEVANDLFAAQYKLTYTLTKDEHEAGKTALDEVLRRFEGALKEPFFAGDFGLVDAAAAPALHRFHLLERKIDQPLLARFPKVAAWAARISARPSVQKGVLPDFEESLLAALRKRGSYFASERLSAA